VIHILDQNGRTVYEGEGELVEYRSALGHQIEIRQEQRVGNESRGRRLDIVGFLNAISPDWSAHRVVRPVPVLDFNLDPPVMEVPIPQDGEVITELRLSCSADNLRWLADILNQSFETPEERRTVHEARRELYRSFDFGIMSGPEARRELGLEAILEVDRSQQNRIDWAALRERVREAGDAMSGLSRVAQGCGFLGQAMQQAIEAEAEEASFTAADARAAMDQVRENHRALQSCAPEDFRAYVREAYGIPAGLIGPDPAHDELIESTLSEFPYDPYQYGRIRPGPEGTSRWTPPEDPEEKIRSCP
jgi:hypothetical protein